MTTTTNTAASHPAAARNAGPYIIGPEAAAITAVLEDGEFGHTATSERFEAAVAEFLGVPEVVGTTSCTDALEIGLRAARIGPGDEVIVPSMTFCASVQAIVATGASPRFIEVDPDTMCVTAAEVRDAITTATRAVMPVLFGGRPVDLSDVQDMLDDRGIATVEDAAQAFGSRAGDTAFVGATGVITCFSFGPIKNITCMQGGALVLRDPEEAERARLLRLLGMPQSQIQRKAATSYSVESFGRRSPLSAVNAAVGLVQLANFDTLAAKRTGLWRAYAAALDGLPGVRLVDVDIARTVPFNCVVRVPRRDEVFASMKARGIGVGVHYPPNHLQPAFAAWARSLPATERLGTEIMSLPFHPAMDAADAHFVVEQLAHAIGETA